MGYTTYFSGEVSVSPPLNEAERTFLTKFAQTRRVQRERGPYFVDGSGFMGQGPDPDVFDGNADVGAWLEESEPEVEELG